MLEYPIQTLVDGLLHSETPGDYDECLRRELAFFDEANAAIIDNSQINLACGAGCSLCCWLRVDVHAHEVLLLAHHIRTHFSPQELADLKNRLAAHAEIVLPLTPFEHATQNLMCPLLREGRCSVYEARPHACRRQHSLDFAACQYTYNHPTDLDFPGAHDRELFHALTETMQWGIEVYTQLGFDNTIYELGTALAEALNDPLSRERWKNHEKVFLHASVTPRSSTD